MRKAGLLGRDQNKHFINSELILAFVTVYVYVQFFRRFISISAATIASVGFSETPPRLQGNLIAPPPPIIPYRTESVVGVRKRTE